MVCTSGVLPPANESGQRQHILPCGDSAARVTSPLAANFLKAVRQNFPLVAPEAKLREELRLAAVVRVCRIEQIIHDFFAADDGFVCSGNFTVTP